MVTVVTLEDSDDRSSKDSHKRAMTILRLEGRPSEQQIRKAFRLRALEVPPDKLACHLKTWGEKEMQELSWAYDVLTAPECSRGGGGHCPGMALMQGPALWVYNYGAEFSADEFDRICNIGARLS